MIRRDIDSRRLSFLEEYPCPYFGDGRNASIEYLFGGDNDAAGFDLFLAEGYRRLGSIFYRNVCDGCRSCMPLRVDLDRFSPSRSQRRTLRRNGDIHVACSPSPFISAAKVDLYRRYLQAKHGEEEHGEYYFETHLSHIHYGYRGAIEMDYFLEGRLIGVGIVDEAASGLSSNYFYYDPRFLHRRPGVFSILREISLARRMGKRYHYLGFCIEKVEKMAYKRFFRPNQIFEDGRWRDYLL